ncbi:hypothetical protein [Streptomyces sp. NPDC001889]
MDGLRARVAALESRTAPDRRHHRVRSFLSALLIVIGCVLAPLSAVAVWTAEEVGDTDRYVATVAPLASDPDVRAAAADRATDAVMDHIDLTSLLEGVAPADRPRLAKALGRAGDALESALRSFVHDKAEAVVSSDTFRRLWTEANRRAHDTVDKALTGSGGGAVRLTDNAVEIDLGPVVDQVKQRLVADGLTVAGKIPEVHTSFVVARSDDIGELRTGFRLLQLAGVWLPVLALLLLVAGVLLAVRRRRAVVAAALGAAFATALLGLALTAFRGIYLDRLPSGVSQPAAEAVYDTFVRFLRATVRMVVTLGVVLALAAWLTGPGRHAVRVRGLWRSGIVAVRGVADRAGLRTGPVGPWLRRWRRWVVWVLVAGAVLAYLLWSHPTGWVVVGLALALVLAVAVVDFLAAEGGVSGESPDTPDTPDSARSAESGNSPERPYPDGGGRGAD